MKILSVFYKVCYIFSRIFNHFLYEPVIKGSMNKCGKNVRIGGICTFAGINNITCGESVFI